MKHYVILSHYLLIHCLPLSLPVILPCYQSLLSFPIRQFSSCKITGKRNDWFDESENLFQKTSSSKDCSFSPFLSKIVNKMNFEEKVIYFLFFCSKFQNHFECEFHFSPFSSCKTFQKSLLYIHHHYHEKQRKIEMNFWTNWRGRLKKKIIKAKKVINL